MSAWRGKRKKSNFPCQFHTRRSVQAAAKRQNFHSVRHFLNQQNKLTFFRWLALSFELFLLLSLFDTGEWDFSSSDGRLHWVLAVYRVHILRKQHHFSSGQHRDRTEAEEVRFLCSANFYRHLSKRRKPERSVGQVKSWPETFKQTVKSWIEMPLRWKSTVKIPICFLCGKEWRDFFPSHELSTWLQGGYSELKH